MPYDNTSSRSTTSLVRFNHPFHLGQDRRELPAGTYAVHTHEDVYQGTFDPIYVATSVELDVRGGGKSSSRFTQPADLAAALAADADRSLRQDVPSENPDRGYA